MAQMQPFLSIKAALTIKILNYCELPHISETVKKTNANFKIMKKYLHWTFHFKIGSQYAKI